MIPKHIWLVSFSAITVASLATGATVLNEPQYELEGEIDASMNLAQGNLKSFDHIRFHAYVKKCAWLIHATPEGENGTYSQYIDYWEFGCDGTNQFRFAANKGGANNPDWLGGVYPEIAPTFSLEPHIPVLWFAVASGCYLDSAGTSPMPGFSVEPSAAPVEAVVQRSRTSPFLPLEASFFSDGFHNGFTNATYRALEMMPLGDLEVPKRFELKTFRRNGNNFEVELECSGKIQVAKRGCSRDDFRPQLPGGTKIRDFRFVSDSAASKHEFAYTSERWLAVDEVQKLPGFENYVRWEPMASKLPSVEVKVASAEIPDGASNPEGHVIIKRSIWIIFILSVFTSVFILLRQHRVSKQVASKHN